MLEEIPRLQGLDGLLVDRRCEMDVAGIIAVLHAAVADFSFQLGIVVDGGNEPFNLLMPLLCGAVGELIFDHEVLHRWLLHRRRCQTFGGGTSPRNTAALRPANSSKDVGGRPRSVAASGQTLPSLPSRRSANNSNNASAR